MDLINMRLSEMSQEQLFEGIELIKRNNEEIADRKRQERAKTEIKTEDAEVVDNATEESNRIKDAWYNLSAFMANSSQFDEELEELEKELEELRKEYGIKSSVECFDEDDFDDLTSIADASRPLTDSELGRYIRFHFYVGLYRVRQERIRREKESKITNKVLNKIKNLLNK